ncbi:hypothetical protein PCL_03686 [Purpureocillium lilacinum]|uniref:Uncharacterized protein n=1 Tax=Purpureocillium lilacinum TaxID=33203 RepID=A0A2U3EPR5_PURLI|nr:hypothetical protein PCL_03686 [Purpureocillium lilacinum]
MDVRNEALADSGKGLIVLPPLELKRTGSHSWPERRRSEDGEVDWGRDGGLPSGWVDWLVGCGWVQHPSGRREELGWAGLGWVVVLGTGTWGAAARVPDVVGKGLASCRSALRAPGTSARAGVAGLSASPSACTVQGSAARAIALP